MSDASGNTEGIPTPVPLETLGDVRRALAKVCNEIRTGHMDLKTGNALIFGYSQLARLMQDQRDAKYKQRLKALWEAHQNATKKQAPAPAEH